MHVSHEQEHTVAIKANAISEISSNCSLLTWEPTEKGKSEQSKFPPSNIDLHDGCRNSRHFLMCPWPSFIDELFFASGKALEVCQVVFLPAATLAREAKGHFR